MARSRPVADPLAPIRAWWLHRQSLTPTTAPKTIEACVRRAGWLPTSGSTGIYLSIRARLPGASREAVDRVAIDGVSLIDVPGVHGRPSVLVPRSEMALALRLHSASLQKHLAPHFASGSISESALRGVAAQVCRLLDEGPLPTAEIRKSISRPNVDELLVGALNDLAVRGIVRRLPIDGRLDSSKYMYELRHPDDRPDLEAEGDAAVVAARGAEHFLRHHGPATLEELAWWGDLTKGAARRALGTLGAEPLAVPGWTAEAWLLPGDLPAWRSFKGEGGDRVVLLPYRDPFVHMRRGPAVLSRTAGAPVLDGTLKRARIVDVSTVNHHTILSGADVVGVWSTIRKPGRCSHASGTPMQDFAGESPTWQPRRRFIREQLGDARLSAVDPPAKRAKRLAFCRES